MYALLLVLAVTPNPCTVRINVADLSGTGSSGTGALVGNIVLTANHVVQDRKENTVLVTFPNGRVVEGTILKIDAKQDLAAIQIPATGITPLKVGEMPADGDRLSIEGYGGGKFAACTGILDPKKFGKEGPTWRKINGCQARSGDSGGPVLNEAGEFVGVLWGSTKGETFFTAIDIVRDFMPVIKPPTPPTPYIIW